MNLNVRLNGGPPGTSGIGSGLIHLHGQVNCLQTSEPVSAVSGLCKSGNLSIPSKKDSQPGFNFRSLPFLDYIKGLENSSFI